jgi:hypothetical protein
LACQAVTRRDARKIRATHARQFTPPVEQYSDRLLETAGGYVRTAASCFLASAHFRRTVLSPIPRIAAI